MAAEKVIWLPINVKYLDIDMSLPKIVRNESGDRLCTI